MTGANGQKLVEAPLRFRLSNGGKIPKDGAFITCPKCHAPCYIRQSVRLTETVKDLTGCCTNPACMFSGKFQVSLVWQISPGLIDRPDLNLPQCPAAEVTHIIPPSTYAKDGEGDDDQINMFSG